MKFEIEWEVEPLHEPNIEEVAAVIGAAFEQVCHVPDSFEANILITDHEQMQAINAETRGIDRTTDVLSFPMLEIAAGSDMQMIAQENAYLADPESGRLLLGDIVLNIDRVHEQAVEYGHSVRRELGFLLCHSLLHLIGYDHMEEAEKTEMEEWQRRIMEQAGISREA
ncbi:MAG: rRNA maturation RNase YbeY [Eubacteriales bacterium]|nr:rRNA maturation RNase YbeY [Eubacteriales bacterium]